jgi:hypothetical protein
MLLIADKALARKAACRLSFSRNSGFDNQAGVMGETLPALPINLEEIGARAAELARFSRSTATERAYRSDSTDFALWCERAGLPALPRKRRRWERTSPIAPLV